MGRGRVRVRVIREISGRSRGDTTEMMTRYRGDTGEIYGEV